MWLVVGLGNPGRPYVRTRHNLGAMVVTHLARALDRPGFTNAKALRARVSANGQVLALPTTYMNESGKPVHALVKKYRVPPDRLLVVHDDKDLAFRRIQLQRNRSAAGHRGVQSVIDALGTKDFWRLRVGIGAPPVGTETDDFVLQTFPRAEEHALRRTVVPSAVSLLIDKLHAPGVS